MTNATTAQIANNPLIISAFKAAITTVRSNPGATLKVVFIKRDGSVREMMVSHDAHMKDAIKGTGNSVAESKRAATNEVRGNLVVRELLPDGSFQWRTIPLSRVLSISPVLP